MCLSMLPKTSTFKSLSYCKTPLQNSKTFPGLVERTSLIHKHVGISVRVAQSNICLQMFISTSHFCLFQCQHISLCSLSQTRVNCRAGRALEHTEGLLWYFVTKESKTATCQLGLQQPNQALSSSQTKCQSHTKTSWNICMFRCKTCPFWARKTPATNFPEIKMILVHASIRRVQHDLEPPPPSVSRALCCPHTTASMFLPLTCAPRLSTGFFWGGKNQPNSMQRKALFVFNKNFTSTSVGKE